MPYEVQNWEDKNPSFPLSAARMNHIEAGIAAAAAASVNVKEFGVKGDGVTNDTTNFQAALTAAKESAAFVPSAGNGYLVNGLSLPAATKLEGMDKWRAILRTNSKTLYLLKAAGQNEIVALRFEAANLQTAGGALDLSEVASYANCEGITFGSNFFIGVNIAGVAKPGAITLTRLTWAESGAGVTGTGTCIKIGDGEHLSVGVNVGYIFILGKEVTGVGQAVEFNFCDSCTLEHALIQTTSKGVSVGNLGKEVTTGLKITDTIVDTCAGPAYDFALARDVQLIGWNAQGASTGVALRGETRLGPPTTSVRIANGIAQINVGNGFVAELGTSYWKLEGNTFSANCTASGESGIYAESGSHDFEIHDNLSGNVILGTGKQKKGIFVEGGVLGGGCDKYIITNNHCPVDATQTIGVDDKGAGTHKEVEHNATF